MAATEPVLLFVDADCSSAKLSGNAHLHHRPFPAARLLSAPAHRKWIDRSRESEELRLATFQEHALQPDGRIRYLNTAGFAIRRARRKPDGLFDPVAQRGEDTLLLANLMKRDELPCSSPMRSLNIPSLCL